MAKATRKLARTAGTVLVILAAVGHPAKPRVLEITTPTPQEEVAR